MSHVFDGCEVGGSVLGSDPALVVAKDHVHHPMQAVLDGPMAADDRSQKVGQQNQRSDLEARLLLDLATIRKNGRAKIPRSRWMLEATSRRDFLGYSQHLCKQIGTMRRAAFKDDCLFD